LSSFFFSCLFQSQATPLHWLPSNASAAVVRLFLDRGANINALTLVMPIFEFTKTCLRNNRDCTSTFAQRKDTPLHYAILRQNVAASTAFIKAGAALNIVSVSVVVVMIHVICRHQSATLHCRLRGVRSW
jgi:ankyrin repeat protein